MLNEKTIHIFRHAEVVHNETATNLVIQFVRDSLLTPHGILQANSTLTGPTIPNFNKPTLVTCSPLIGCLHTALYAFHPEFNEHLKSNS